MCRSSGKKLLVQGSILGPILYLLYINDIPDLVNGTIATFAGDTAILAIEINHEEVDVRLQASNDQINTWTKKWRIKLTLPTSMANIYLSE